MSQNLQSAFQFCPLSGSHLSTRLEWNPLRFRTHECNMLPKQLLRQVRIDLRRGRYDARVCFTIPGILGPICFVDIVLHGFTELREKCRFRALEDASSLPGACPPRCTSRSCRRTEQALLAAMPKLRRSFTIQVVPGPPSEAFWYVPKYATGRCVFFTNPRQVETFRCDYCRASSFPLGRSDNSQFP